MNIFFKFDYNINEHDLINRGINQKKTTYVIYAVFFHINI